MRSTVSLLAVLALSLLAAVPALAADAEIRVLSNRADLVSGGDALVQVTPAGSRVELNGQDVTAKFAPRPDGRWVGLLEGLRLGDNEVVAAGQRLTITNHPIGGPVLAGPQIQPWTCQDTAKDKKCNEPPEVDYFYKPPAGDELLPYDSKSPPSDVATTTTDQGRRVPFIVRHEIGVLDRDEYRIAVLYDPSKPWAPWMPQEGYNHKRSW